jgi:hypothetical protein
MYSFESREGVERGSREKESRRGIQRDEVKEGVEMSLIVRAS